MTEFELKPRLESESLGFGSQKIFQGHGGLLLTQQLLAMLGGSSRLVQ